MLQRSPGPRNNFLGYCLVVAILAGCLVIMKAGCRLPESFNLMSLSAQATLAPSHRAFLFGVAGPLAFTLLICAGLSCPRRLQNLFTFAIVIVAFSLALTELWTSAASTREVVGGFLPNSDARAYIFEASRLIEGHNFSSWGSRRPLASAYLAALLWISDGNLRVTISILCLFTAVSIALLLVQIRKRFGIVAAGTAFLVLFYYYRRYLGSTLSESCGLTFGALGLALLLEGFERKDVLYLNLGSICLAVGLNARAGAFFVLPCLLIAIIWNRRKERLRALLIAALAGCFIAGVTVANFAVLKILGAEDALMFSNFGVVLYGTIHGGDWTLVYHQHPEVFELPKDYAEHPGVAGTLERKQAMAVYRLVWEDVRKHPSLVLKGAFRAWTEFFTNRNGPYVYVPNWVLEKALLATSAIGVLFAALTVHKRSAAGLILSGAAGIVLSLPFVPPWDADLMRAYATTIPFLALASGSGTAALIMLFGRIRRFFWPRDSIRDLLPESSSYPLAVTATILLFCIYIVPVVARYSTLHAEPTVLMRDADVTDLTITLNSGNMLRILSTDAKPAHISEVRQRDFINGLSKHYSKLWSAQADHLQRLVLCNPIFVVPGSTGLGFIVLRTRATHSGGRVHLKGKVHLLEEGNFFVEDGIPFS